MATGHVVGRAAGVGPAAAAAARRGGFTLIEILIVVMILGIMAGIVVPSFNDVAREVRAESLKEQLREVRTITQLYRLQHMDAAPNLNRADWTDLTQAKPNVYGTVCGPYLKSVPKNPLNNFSEVAVVNADQAWGDPVAGVNVGFVLHAGTGMIWATNRAGNMIYNEDNPNDPNN